MPPDPPASARQLSPRGRVRPPDAAWCRHREAGIERVETFRHRQRRHEIAPGKADLAFHLAFVVSLSRPPKAIFKKVMTLQLREHLRAQTLAPFHDLGDRQFGIVVENRLRHAAEESKRRHMAIPKG